MTVAPGTLDERFAHYWPEFGANGKSNVLVRHLLGQFFTEEIAGPLGADFHIGMNPADAGRVSPVTSPQPLDLENNLTTAYVMNPMVLEFAPDSRPTRPAGRSHSDAYVAAIYEAVA